MQKRSVYYMHECDYCGESQKSPQGRAAHMRFCNENPENKKKSKEENASNTNQTSETFEDIDSRTFKGELGDLEVKDFDQPRSICPNCSARVKPGTNCQECGHELDWYAEA